MRPSHPTDLPEPLETVIVPRSADLGGFDVRRALPSRQRRLVGPFVFFDQFGPGTFETGRGLDVRPHPHIGLATLTYVFEGAILHRDSLGNMQRIEPGALNWMLAGRGIAHSERTPPEARKAGGSLHGVQVWLALPRHDEERAPEFVHHDALSLPVIDAGGVQLRLIAGQWQGARGPVRTLSETLYADAVFSAGSRVEISPDQEERAVYIVDGKLSIDGTTFDSGQLLVLKPESAIVLQAAESKHARAMLIGGAALEGPRHVWWNFVSSSRARIEQAKADWQAGRFGPIPEETEFIPLPGEPPPPVRYP